MMETERLNRWLTLGANIGVLIGIFLLIIELHQNREMMKAQTRNVLSGQVSGFLLSTASDKDLSELKHRAENGEDLSIEEEKRYLYHFAGNLRIWENIHYQYRQGMFDELEFEAERNTWKSLIVWNKRFSSEWCRLRSHYSAEFVAEIDKLLDDKSCQGERHK